MPQYSQHGLAFLYPDGWTISEDSQPEQFSVTVESPETSYWVLTLLGDCPDPEEVVQTVLDAFQDEYEDVDAYPAQNPGTDVSEAWEMEFVCLELLNTVSLRVYELPEVTAMVMFQGTDHELANTRDELESITDSLRFSLFDLDDEDDLPAEG